MITTFVTTNIIYIQVTGKLKVHLVFRIPFPLIIDASYRKCHLGLAIRNSILPVPIKLQELQQQIYMNCSESLRICLQSSYSRLCVVIEGFLLDKLVLARGQVLISIATIRCDIHYRDSLYL